MMGRLIHVMKLFSDHELRVLIAALSDRAAIYDEDCGPELLEAARRVRDERENDAS